MKLVICTKFHVNRMNCVESRSGGGGGASRLLELRHMFDYILKFKQQISKTSIEKT